MSAEDTTSSEHVRPLSLDPPSKEVAVSIDNETGTESTENLADSANSEFVQTPRELRGSMMREDLARQEVNRISSTGALIKKMKTLPFVRLRDKISFVAGTANIMLLAFFAGGHQFVLPYMYTIKYPILIFFRFYSYKKNYWHYFLLDFCYYANAALLVWMWYPGFRDEYRLFTIIFCIIRGPLCWAVVIFRNSLVFHSIDKITSCFIHVSPAIVTYGIRWYINPDTEWFHAHVCKDYDPVRDKTANPNDCEASLIDTWLWPTIFAACHMTMYYIIVHQFKRNKIDRNKAALTSYRYIVESNPKSLAARASNIFGPRFGREVFSVLSVVQTSLMCLPTILFYKWFWADTVFIALIILVMVWNGANFYIEVFSRKYEGVRDEKQDKDSTSA